MPDLRQRSLRVIQRRKARGSCQSSTRGSRAWLDTGTLPRLSTAHPPASCHTWELLETAHTGSEHKTRTEARSTGLRHRSQALSPAVAKTQVSYLGFQGRKQFSFTLESREGMVQSSQQSQSQLCSCNYVLKCALHVKEGTFSNPHFFLSP